MNYHLTAVLADLFLITATVYRIEHDGLFESGSMLRISVLCTAGWLFLGDLDHYFPGEDIFPFAGVDQPFRMLVTVGILSIGITLDIYRAYMRAIRNNKP